MGHDTFFVCPGSRSTPLAIAIARAASSPHHRLRMKVVVHHDERGAGFAAVGYARAVGRAAVVVTTSGTARVPK